MSVPPIASRPRTYVAYGSMLALAVGAFLVIRAHGETLVAPSLRDAPLLVAPQAAEHGAFHLVFALVVIVLFARVVGVLFRYLQQPPVIGEVIAGLMLGPSLFGTLAPEARAFVFPGGSVAPLSAVAQVGVVLFMFLVGLELDAKIFRERSHSTLAISHASIVLPFLLGSLLALFLYPRLSSRDVGFTNFSLFMGVALSVTAFPVLARILLDRGMQRSELGRLALACAAVDDVTAWCLLAIVVGIVRATASSALVTLGLTLGYVLFVLLAVRPLVGRWVVKQERTGRVTKGATALALLGLLGSALLTEAIGIHALFGAFLFGAIVPHESRLARELIGRLQGFVVVLLLPVFFAFTGLRTQVGLLATASDWLLAGVIILVACAGKIGGSLLAARLSGLGMRDAAVLGVLLNTRGLMELIVLNVGLDLGVISPRLFAMLVVMAVVTTLSTSPLLSALKRRGEAGVTLTPAETPAP